MSTTSSQFVPLDALAAELALPRSYLRRLAEEGVVPALDVNGRLRFDVGAVRDALARIAARLPEATQPAEQGVTMDDAKPDADRMAAYARRGAPH